MVSETFGGLITAQTTTNLGRCRHLRVWASRTTLQLDRYTAEASSPERSRIDSATEVAADSSPRLSSLPEVWDTQDIENDFRRHTQGKGNVVHKRRKTPKRNLTGRNFRSGTVVDSSSWGITKGQRLSKQQQSFLCSKYQEWNRLDAIRKRLALQSNGEQISEASWAKAADISTVELRQIRLDGGNAADLLLASVTYLLQKEAFRSAHYGVEVEDVIQEAQNIWLDAALSYDPTRNAAFTSFGVMFLRQRLFLEVEKLGQLLDQPALAAKLEYKCRMASLDLEERIGRPPTSAEIAKQVKLPLARVRNLLKNAKATISTETKAKGEVDSQEGETIADTIPSRPDENEHEEHEFELMEREMRLQLRRHLGDLFNDKEDEDLFVQYYCLDGGQEKSYKTLGQKFGLSAEGVRKRLRKAQKLALGSPKARAILMPYSEAGIIHHYGS